MLKILYYNYETRNFLLSFFLDESGFLTPYMDLRLTLPTTPDKSYFPRIQEKWTPGRSLAPTPEIKTSECFLKLWPFPGIWATRCFLFDNKILTTGLRAELGFLGVVIRTFITTPFIWGLLYNTGFSFFLKNLLMKKIWFNVVKKM